MLFTELNPQLLCQVGEYLQKGIYHMTQCNFSFSVGPQIPDNARGWEQTERGNIHISFLGPRPADFDVTTSVNKE